ncbi:unnamed protein product [Amoebophrya sp. A120]|nr:unnamed protein product [Amoebophrya sp. A120]|eukprot:GSA120T00020238001.1
MVREQQYTGKVAAADDMGPVPTLHLPLLEGCQNDDSHAKTVSTTTSELEDDQNSSKLNSKESGAVGAAPGTTSSSSSAPKREKVIDDSHISIDRREPDPWQIVALKVIFILPWRFLGVCLSFPVLFLFYFCACGEWYLWRKLFGKIRPVRESVLGSAGWRVFLFLNGIVARVEFENSNENYNNLRDAPFTVANHVGYLDGAVLPTCLHRPRPVFISWVLDVFIIGKMARDLNGIPVDLRNSASRQQSMERIQQHANEWAKYDEFKNDSSSSENYHANPRDDPKYHKAQSCLIFPEGGCCNGDRLGTFKKGAFLSKREVRPVIVHWTCVSRWNTAFTDFYIEKDQDTAEQKQIVEKFCDADEILQEVLDANSSNVEVIVDKKNKQAKSDKTSVADDQEPRLRFVSSSTAASSRPSTAQLLQPESFLVRQNNIPMKKYSFARWFLRYLCEPYFLVRLKCLPIYFPNEQEKEDAEVYAANIQRLMQREYQHLRKQQL